MNGRTVIAISLTMTILVVGMLIGFFKLGEASYEAERGFLVNHQCHVLHVDDYSHRTEYQCTGFTYTGRLHEELK